MSRRYFFAAAVCLSGLVLLVAAGAQGTSYPPLPPFHVPDDVAVRHVDIYSEGTRMSGQFYSEKKNAGKKLPTIIMAHGWGGLAAYLDREAVPFAEAGYLVLTFDYRGWGTSDSRVVLTQKSTPADANKFRFNAEVQEEREAVGPLDMVTDWQNAIDFAVGDAQCDPNRIGLWGSSLSGGLVVSAAERDPRVKAIHSQVGAMDGRWVLGTPQMRSLTYAQSTQRAENDTLLPLPGSGPKLLGLEGAPILQQFASWFPVELIDKLPNVAIQFVLAGDDGLVDNKPNGLRAYALAKGPKNLVVIPGLHHFGIYNSLPDRNHARDLAIAWFDRYLKSTGPQTGS